VYAIILFPELVDGILVLRHHFHLFLYTKVIFFFDGHLFFKFIF